MHGCEPNRISLPYSFGNVLVLGPVEQREETFSRDSQCWREKLKELRPTLSNCSSVSVTLNRPETGVDSNSPRLATQ
jgi:hypothetical protein